MERPVITVDDIMTIDLATLPENATLQDAIQLMAEKHIRHIPIVNSAREPIGLITHETFRHGGRRDQPAQRRPPDRKAQVRLLAPRETDGKLRGIITDSDFVAVAINLLQQLNDLEPPEIDI